MKILHNLIHKIPKWSKKKSSIASIKTDTKTISRLIEKQHARTPFNYAILWQWNGIKFLEFSKDLDFHSWENGLIFGEKAQIQWRQLGSKFQLCLISDGKDADFWQDCLAIQCDESFSGINYLLGRKTTPKNGHQQWYEPGIPFFLSEEKGYPLDTINKDKVRVGVRMKRYTMRVDTPDNLPGSESPYQSYYPSYGINETLIQRCTGVEER